MPRILIITFCMLCAMQWSLTSANDWENPQIFASGREPARATAFPMPLRLRLWAATMNHHLFHEPQREMGFQILSDS